MLHPNTKEKNNSRAMSRVWLVLLIHRKKDNYWFACPSFPILAALALKFPLGTKPLLASVLTVHQWLDSMFHSLFPAVSESCGQDPSLAKLGGHAIPYLLFGSGRLW